MHRSSRSLLCLPIGFLALFAHFKSSLILYLLFISLFFCRREDFQLSWLLSLPFSPCLPFFIVILPSNTVFLLTFPARSPHNCCLSPLRNRIIQTAHFNFRQISQTLPPRPRILWINTSPASCTSCTPHASASIMNNMI